MMIKFGLHFSTNFNESVKKKIINNNIKCIQIFVFSPVSFKPIKFSNIEKIKNFCEKNNISIYVHSNYLTSRIWKLSSIDNNEKKNKLISLLKNQLKISDIIKAKGFIIHIPKKNIDDIIIEAKLIFKITNKYSTKIFLENPSLKPDEHKTFETAHKLNKFMYNFHKNNINNFYLCIDSSHLWNSNVDIRSYNNVQIWFNNFKYINKIKLFHLNGSFNDKSIFKDKHAIPFSKDDKIWNKYKNNIDKSGFYKFIELSKKNKIPIILEINRGNDEEIKYIMNMFNKLI